jgi:hypothetical protein
MTSRLFAESIPEARFESFLTLVFGEREVKGQGRKLSLRWVVGWVPEAIPVGQTGQLVLDSQDLQQPLSLRVTVGQQETDVAIIRYDGTNTPGESYKDPECRYPDKEALHMTPSQGTRDLLSILDFVENNPHFLAREVIVVSFSFSALYTRKALLSDDKKRIGLWLAPMGATDLKDLMLKISGGIDYFALCTAGKDLGEVTVLGTPMDGSRFCRDAFESGFVSIEDAVEDMSHVETPVVWFYGEHDAWIDPENVERLMRACRSPFKIRILPTGHVPLNGAEALHVFAVRPMS